MRILAYIFIGMVIAYLSLLLGEFGLVLLGGATFGLLLYIALILSNKNK